MDLVSLINALSEAGVTIVICAFFFMLVLRMQKQDDRNEKKLEEAHKNTREISEQFVVALKESQEKYFQSMQEVTGRMASFEAKLDNLGSDVQDLKREINRGGR